MCKSLHSNGALHVYTDALYWNFPRQSADLLLVNPEVCHQGCIHFLDKLDSDTRPQGCIHLQRWQKCLEQVIHTHTHTRHRLCSVSVLVKSVQQGKKMSMVTYTASPLYTKLDAVVGTPAAQPYLILACMAQLASFNVH